jgi:hypothetical protein
LDLLLESKDTGLLECVSTNPNLQRRHLETLARHPMMAVQEIVAQHPQCPVDILRDLLERNIEVTTTSGIGMHVAMKIAQNPNCDRTLYERMLDTQMQVLRSAVASSPHTPQDLLIGLVGDTDVSVQSGLRNNPNLPEEYRALLRVVR